MPANLTPEYKAAEEQYRQAKDPHAKLACLEQMLSTIPKHKGTEKMQADIKKRIKSLRDGMQRGSGRSGFSIKVEKEGVAQVALIGAANAGKSALVEITTNARTETADHPFSTRQPAPGMFQYENMQFQLVDLPPLNDEFMEHWVIDIIRNSDTALWIIDASDEDLMSQVDEVESLLTRKKIILIGPNEEPSFGHDPVRRIYTLVVATKMDNERAKKGFELLQEKFEPRMAVLPCSALGDTDFKYLGQALFQLCKVIRVYSKMPGKDPDLTRPYFLNQGDTLIDFARFVHKDFAENLRFARVWGKAKFDGQRVQRDQKLYDGDIVELHI